MSFRSIRLTGSGLAAAAIAVAGPDRKQARTMITEPVIVPTRGIKEKKKAMNASFL